MYTVFIWVTLLCGDHAQAIISKLVELGYTVGSAKPNSSPLNRNEFSSHLALKVQRSKELPMRPDVEGNVASHVLRDTEDVLKALKASWFSTSACAPFEGMLSWGNGLIFAPLPKAAQPAGAAALLSDEEEIG